MTAQDPFERAVQTARGLKPGTWEAVESLAVLALAEPGRPEALELLRTAGRTAVGLKAGTWQAVRALAWLARAERELAG